MKQKIIIFFIGSVGIFLSSFAISFIEHPSIMLALGATAAVDALAIGVVCLFWAISKILPDGI